MRTAHPEQSILRFLSQLRQLFIATLPNGYCDGTGRFYGVPWIAHASCVLSMLLYIGLGLAKSPDVPTPAYSRADPLTAAFQALDATNVRESEAVLYGFVIITVAIAIGVLLVARNHRHERQQRREMRKHVSRLSGPSDAAM